jgi:hypothetical protein
MVDVFECKDTETCNMLTTSLVVSNISC